ncbi:hypothetical protein ABPG75_008207 [Micractinium tetrahymenae]
MVLHLLLLALSWAERAAAAEWSEGSERDLVPSLPTVGALDFQLHSGYLPVDAASGRALFYLLAEYEGHEPVDRPLLLWLQGGPGCSSVGLGAFQELGPFLPDFEGENVSTAGLMRNPHSWTLAAHVLFLDSPAFTGFSFSADNTTDRRWGDANVTADHLAALLAFYERHPWLRGQPLFLAGESYAGHYVPLLAAAIFQHNRRHEPDWPIMLEGYALGNPWTDPAHDNAGAVQFWYGEDLISADTYRGLLAACNLSATALWRTEGESGVGGECAKHRDAALAEAGGYQLYGVNAPLCVLRPDGTPQEPQPDWQDLPNPLYDPCSHHRVRAYMRRQDVQEALHAIQPGAQARNWTECDARAISYEVESLLDSMLPVHRANLEAGMRVLIYSGDTDGVVPTLGTRSWVEALGLHPAAPLRTWADKQTGEVAGYVSEYEGGLTFATLHEAGHAAPYFKPSAALQLIQSFLNQEPPGAPAAVS